MICTVKVEDSGTSFPSDENTRACVPRLISEHDACIESTVSSPCEVNSRRAKHANALSVRGEVFHESTTYLVHAFCTGAECVLVYRYECGIECLSCTHVESLTIDVGAMFTQCIILRS